MVRRNYSNRRDMTLDGNVVDAFRNDGAAILRGVFRVLDKGAKSGIDVNMATPGPHTKNYTKDGEPVSFLVTTVTESNTTLQIFLFESPAKIAAELMGSSKVNLFHEHVSRKEPAQRIGRHGT